MNEIKFIGKSVFIPNDKILVITDVHLGYEEMLNNSGIFLPRLQFKQTVEDIQAIFKETGKLEKVIILGDLKHEFGDISRQEWNETLKFIELLEGHAKEIILVKGNHDTILEPIAKKRDVKVQAFYKFKNYLFVHGDKIVDAMEDKDVEYIFAGHLHPTVTLKDGVKAEKYKCFLVGKYGKKKLIVVPSFIPLTVGADLMMSGLKLFDGIRYDDFEVYAVEDKVYSLGKYKDLKS